MPIDRSLEDIRSYWGNFPEIIDRSIAKNGKARILEAGCGHGLAMMELARKYGNKVEITGINYSREHGSTEKMLKCAMKKGGFSSAEISGMKLPKMVFCDAGKRLPFEDGSFDFIYSYGSFYLFDDKIGFLQECNRILAKDGIARISPGFEFNKDRQPKEYTHGLEIWDNGRQINPRRFFNMFSGVRCQSSDESVYIEIRKQKELDLGLSLVAAVDSNLIFGGWMGVKSIYTTQTDFRPNWKSDMMLRQGKKGFPKSMKLWSKARIVLDRFFHRFSADKVSGSKKDK